MNTPGQEDQYLELADPGGIINEPYKSRMDFWNQLNVTFHGERVYY